MKLIINFLLLVVLISGADIMNLYTNHRAMKKDDILTVLIVENAKAGSQSLTQTGKESSMKISNVKGSGSLDFIPAFGASGGMGTDYSGKGETKREGSLIGTIAARVVDVMDNGNLFITGEKLVEINEEKEVIKINGIVRPQDIMPNNTVYSYNISEAKITYSGKGVASKGRRPGLIPRILNFLF